MKRKKYIIDQEQSIFEAIVKLDHLSRFNILTLFVVDHSQKICGTVTDGDIRRGFIKGADLNTSVSSVMNPDFVYVTQGDFDIVKYRDIKAKSIKLVPVLDNNGNLVDIYNYEIKKSYLPLDAVLMAGGKGERLRPLTENTPKPLLKINDKSIIDYNVDNLIDHGIKNIHVTVNYLAEQLQRHFSHPIDGVHINCICEKDFLGTIGSVKLIQNLENDTILIMNSDLFTNINLEDFFFHFLDNNADMSIAAIPYQVNIPYAVFDLEGRDIKALNEKPTYNYYANAGIYLLRKEHLELIPDGSFFHATDLAELLISRDKKVVRFPHAGYWIDIGKPEDYRKAQDFAKHIR